MFEDLLINVRVNQDGVRDGINGVSNAMRGLKNTFGSLNKVIGMGKMYMLAGAMSKMIKSTLDMTETVNLFNVSMGDMAVATNASLLDLSKLSGLDLTNLQDSVATYSLLARSMGMSSVQSSQLSMNTTKLAMDLSSLTNVPIQRVMQDLRSGLLGQSETVYKYGMDVTEAGLKTEAMNQGISKSVRDMSQGEKMALRYSTMIRQSGLAQGDFAKTIEVPANQLRILSDRFVTLGRSIGSIFIPIIGALLPYLNALVSILTDVANAIASFFGFKAPEVENITNSAVGGIGDVKDGLDGATGSAGKTTKALKEMKKATMGFDELNILPDPKSDNGSKAGGGAGGGGDSILPTFEMPSYDSLTSGIKQVSDDIKKTILDVISAVDFQPLINSLSGLWDNTQPILENLTIALSWLWDEILVPLGQWTIGEALPAFFDVLSSALTVLNPLLEVVGELFKDFWDSTLQPIASFAGDVFVQFLKDTSDALLVVGDWMSNNKDTVRTITELVIGFMVAWNVLKLLGFISQCGGVVAALSQVTVAVVGGTIAKIADNVVMVAAGAKYLWLTGLKIAHAVATTAVTVATAIWTTVCTIATAVTTALGVAFAFLTSPIGLVILAIVAVIAIGVLLYKNWDVIKEFAITTWNKIVENIKSAFNGIKEWFAKIFKDVWNAITSVFSAVGSFFGGIWATIKGIFTSIGSSIGDAIGGAFKTVVNAIITFAEKTINGFINAINGAIGLINKIPGVEISTIQTLSIPKLARGGMVDGGGMFQAGENGKAEMIGNYQGKTTVMPLENTSFVNSMANAVYGAVKSAIPSTKSDTNDYPSELILQVGSTEFGRVAINSINKITKQEGRLALNI